MPQYRPLGTVSAPAAWTLPASLAIQLEAAFAHYDGSGAAGSFLPCLKILSDSGDPVAEIPMDASVAAGSSVEATWAPFLRGLSAGGGGGGVPIVGFSTFAPAAAKLEITSTNQNAPTNVVTSPSFTADGTTMYRVDFGVAGMDIQIVNPGTGVALLTTLSIDSTILGIVADYNIDATEVNYGLIPCYLSVFDTPAAGTHTYSIGAYKASSGGATYTSFFYGKQLSGPGVGVTHAGFLAIIAVHQV